MSKEPIIVYFVAETGEYMERDGKPAFVRKTNDGKFVDSYTGDLLEVRPLPYKPPKPLVKPQSSDVSSYEKTAQQIGEAQRHHSRNKLTTPVREPERPRHENFCQYWSCPLAGCSCKVSRGK